MVLLHFRCHYKSSCLGGSMIGDDVAIISWLKDNKSVLTCLAGKEVDATRPHLHAIVEFDKTSSTFRQQFKKVFPTYDGNSDYSLKEVENLVSLQSYVMKESVVLKKGYTDEQISQIPPWKPKEEYKNEKKKKVANINEQIVIDLRKKYPTKKWQYVPDDINVIVSMIQKYYGAGFKQINGRKVGDNALGILNSLNTGCLHNKLMNEAFPDLFCNPFLED